MRRRSLGWVWRSAKGPEAIKVNGPTGRVARVPVRFQNHAEGAPGPSPLGTGDVGTIQRGWL